LKSENLQLSSRGIQSLFFIETGKTASNDEIRLDAMQIFGGSLKIISMS